MRPLLLCLIVAGWMIGCGCNDSSLEGHSDADAHLPEPDVIDVDLDTVDVELDRVDSPTDPDVEPDPLPDVPPETGIAWPDVVDGCRPPLGLLPYVAQCGNGVIDPGEECDDRNRLDGDGCDWSCHLGDGAPPPPVDPAASPYMPDGAPVSVLSTDLIYHTDQDLPLVWTGSEYATAYFELGLTGKMEIHFLRFDNFGGLVGGVERIELPTSPAWMGDEHAAAGLDLLWTGVEFALFLVEVDRGIILLRLDVAGIPVASPVLVEPDPCARGPSADLTPSGYVLAWTTVEMPPPSSYSSCGRAWGSAFVDSRLRHVAADGTTTGLPGPVLVDDDPKMAPDVAAGPTGFGVITGDLHVIDMRSRCEIRFVHVSPDLSSLLPSGYQGDGGIPNLIVHDGHFLIAWSHGFQPSADTTETCVSRFTYTGDLARPPICSNAFASSRWGDVSNAASGPDGLGIIYVHQGDSVHDLFFLSTDMLGTAVTMDQLVPTVNFHFQLIGIAYSTDGFGTVFPASSGISFQRFMH